MAQLRGKRRLLRPETGSSLPIGSARWLHRISFLRTHRGALLGGLVPLLANCGVQAASGSASGRVRSAATLDPATTGSVALTINGVPWGAQAAIDGSGNFDFGTVVWAAGTATCQFQTSGTGFIDGGPSLTLQPAGSVYADILLAPGSSISGTVTDAATNQPISAGAILMYDAGGVLLGSAPVAVDGTYKRGGFVAGTHYARTDFPDYLDLLWDSIPCPAGDCAITSGTPIQFVDESSNDVADFQLTPT